MTRREYLLVRIIQLGALAIVGLSLVIDMYKDGRPWWLAAGLVVVQAILTNLWPERRYALFLAIEVAVTTALMFLDPTFLIFGFTLSANAAALYPNRTGVFWIALMALLTGAVLTYHWGWSEGLVSTLAIAGGYVSIGLFSYTRAQSERGRRETQALLEDLRTAHGQLQEYAARVEELAVAEERNRLAREMHDTLGHRLTVASVQLEGAQRLIAAEPERAARMVGTVRDQVREALAQLRRTVATLRTPLEVDLPLPQALDRLARGFERATDIAVHLTLPRDTFSLPGPHRLALYRAAQEGLTNVQRHARAGEAWLDLALQDGAIALTIGDDGVGFQEGAEGAGFGLRGMRERAAQLGGDLELGAREDGGAQLVFRLSLPAEGGDG